MLSRTFFIWSIFSCFSSTKFRFTDAAHARKRIVQGMMPRRSNSYDKQITTFDPKGNLLQLEYAQRAASKGSTGLFFCIGEDCIIAVLESTSSEEQNRSMYRIHDGILAKMTGLQGDSRVLAKYLLQKSLQLEWMEGHLQEHFSCLRVKQVADICAEVQHSLTTRPGARPLAVDVVLLGIDGTVQNYDTTEKRGTHDHCYHRMKLGLYKCHLSGVIDTCKFCIVGNIMSDRVMCNDAMKRMDLLWKQLHFEANDHASASPVSADKKSVTSNKSELRKNAIQTISSIVFKYLDEQKKKDEAPLTKSALDIYIITPNPHARGGINISCATCVTQEYIDQVYIALENSITVH